MAGNALKNNKRRSAIMILAIFLASFMLFSVFSAGTTFFKMQKIQNIRINGADFDAIMYGITDEQMQKLKSDSDIERFGIEAVAGFVEETKYDKTPGVSLAWADETFWEEMAAPAREKMKGKYPTEDDEVLVTKEALEKCGFSGLGIGDTMTFTYGNILGDKKEISLRICGIWDGYGETSAFYVSEKFYEGTGLSLADVGSGHCLMKFRKNIMTQKEQDAFIEKMNLGKQQRLFFLSDMASSVQILGGMAGIVLVTCFCAYLLIYNIMYLSVAGNIRYYGLLQTIGMTGRQISMFMRRQMLLAGTMGVTGGVLCGGFVSLFLIPAVVKTMGIRTKQAGAVQVSFHPAIFLFTIIFTGITIWVAGRKPIKTAIRCSPVEALGYSPVSRARKRRGSKSGNLMWRLAKEQVLKDKKKSAVVMLSLAAGLSVFVCVTTLITSQDAREWNYNYRNLDMVIQNDTIRKEKKEERRQIIDENLLKELKNVEGISEVSPIIYSEIIVPWEEKFTDKWMREFYETWMSIPYEDEREEYKEHPENFGSSIVGITKEDFEDLNASLEKPVDEEKFLKGESCLIYRNGLFGLENDDVAGKQITCAQYERQDNTRTYEIAGMTDEGSYTALLGYPPTIIVIDKEVEAFTDSPMISKVGIRYEKEYDEAAEKEIHAILEASPDDRDFSYESKLEQMKTVKKAQGKMMGIGMGIVLILAFIGMMNYINTSVGNVQSRLVELSVMESVGMTGRQMKNMLMLEGMIYACGAWTLTATAGLGITYALFRALNYRDAEFQVPAAPLLIAAVFVVTLCAIVPVRAYQSLEKKASVIERIHRFE